MHWTWQINLQGLVIKLQLTAVSFPNINLTNFGVDVDLHSICIVLFLSDIDRHSVSSKVAFALMPPSRLDFVYCDVRGRSLHRLLGIVYEETFSIF